VNNKRTERIRDPIHGLIVFRKGNDVDQLAWRLINTREFQRLRRIRQLGFSELVFPGATHTRFSHCIGVFHTARQLVEVIRREDVVGLNEHRAQIATLAALLHDVGHGPFSHTFEIVEKQQGKLKRHEEWTAEIITGDTEIHAVLDDMAEEIATLLTQKEPADIYACVVSSQFDADRLDYLRRDRYMTGTGSGSIDVEWLLDGLRVGSITINAPGEADLVEVPGFYLNHKALRTAEEYLLARFNLYQQVYLHKTTRAAERMLGALLAQVANLARGGNSEATGLHDKHPLLRYFAGVRSLSFYLALDDSVVWSSLPAMASANANEIAYLATALLNRHLYKCFDAGEMARTKRGDSLQRYRRALKENSAELGFVEGVTLLEDEAKVTVYGVYRFDEPGALQKVLIEPSEGQRPEDISELSDVLRGIQERRLYRVYAPDREGEEKLGRLWKDVNR